VNTQIAASSWLKDTVACSPSLRSSTASKSISVTFLLGGSYRTLCFPESTDRMQIDRSIWIVLLHSLSTWGFLAGSKFQIRPRDYFLKVDGPPRFQFPDNSKWC
jgi:hypothetical protein